MLGLFKQKKKDVSQAKILVTAEDSLGAQTVVPVRVVVQPASESV